ncbi:hypothetical protein CF319_g5966 [Tilletia indica]|nr:hypothetical protein CF319_g5966 [Tilletia indica]
MSLYAVRIARGTLVRSSLRSSSCAHRLPVTLGLSALISPSSAALTPVKHARPYSTATKTEPLPPTLRELLRSHSKDSSGSIVEGQKHRVHAWVRFVRSHRKVSFLALTDGTLPADEVLQAVVPTEMLPQASPSSSTAEAATTSSESKSNTSRRDGPRDGSHGTGTTLGPGSAVRLVGELVPSKGSGQAVELKVESLEVLGRCEAGTYPLAMPQQLTSETVRRLAHLRARTLRFAAVLRSRHALLRGLENYFDNHDFLRVTTPIMTSSDCEGAGEVFQVIADSDAAQVFAGQLSREGQESSGPISAVQIAKDLSGFFSSCSTYLTVSSQLHLEAITALAHPRTYTIAPAFRAEGSATSRHLSEFWMCEAEVAWIDADDTATPSKALEQTMSVCEASVKAALRTAVGSASASPSSSSSSDNGDRTRDSDFLHDASSRTSDDGKIEVDSLRHYADEDTAPWPRITYAQAIERLQQRHRADPSSAFFSIEPVWGQGLASEHERWLASEHGPWKDRSDFSQAPKGGPVFVTDFPAEVKAFYMRVNGDSSKASSDRTVACFDLLVPRVGELAGGSVREEREDILRARMHEYGLSTHSKDLAEGEGDPFQEKQPVARNMDWYARDLRRYGCAPHGGFGIGVERLVSWATGTESVRDCITYPRTTGAVRF